MKQKIAFATIMSVITTGIISFTLISINIGHTNNFIQIWLKSWGIACMVAILTSLMIAPQVQKFVKYAFKEKTTEDKSV
jgi:membrane protein YdbS with pleckstrin-like domain